MTVSLERGKLEGDCGSELEGDSCLAAKFDGASGLAVNLQVTLIVNLKVPVVWL